MALVTLDDERILRRRFLWANLEPLNWLTARGLSWKTISRAELGYVPDRHAISIPYLNPDRTTRLNRLRYLVPGHVPKYWTPAGGGVHLYQVKNTKLPVLWITEGEFDALILEQLGFPAVACSGTKGFKPAWKYLFVYCRRVTVVADGDEVGRSAARRTASLIGPFVDDIRVVDMPEGMDVTDLHLHDPARLKAMVE